MDHAPHFIAGEFLNNKEDVIESIDPATGNRIGSAVLGSNEISRKAISVAREAFEKSKWKGDIRLRSKVLLQLATNLRQQQDNLAKLLVQENGKPLLQAQKEINAAISEAEYYAGLARSILGRTLERAPNTFSFFNKAWLHSNFPFEVIVSKV